MDSVRFARLKEEFQALLGAGRDRRDEALRRLAAEDAALGAALAAWLSAEEADAATWLERPAALGLETEEEIFLTAALPERVGPWRLVEEIGRGGMGSVFLGRRDDGAFEQTVAVKLVRAELASDLLRRRFLAERRILAGLVHPNIAHLIDGGATPEGIPYLVLEHVAGEPIDRYCERRALSIEARLRLFLVVCGAVDFAHRKLVLHRDIKPGNVLVDETGVPKLLDFGIAKLLEASSAEEAGDDWTALGGIAPLTPGWASPEQLRGDPLTTASDVYSLGVLLHHLLSGRRPEPLRDGSEESGLDRRALRGDLQQIVARALAPEIERRYGTVGELAADLDRHLSGRPVLAHPPSLRYRFGKLIRRHRAAFAGAAVATLGLFVGTAVSLRQAHLAEVQRLRAERRFADVRRLANVVLFDLHDALENVPGAMPARRLLVDTALRYLDDLAAEAGAEPALLEELAVAYERVAEIQGMPTWPSEGRTGDALASLQRSLSLVRRGRAAAKAHPIAGSVVSGLDESEPRLLVRIGSVLAARGDTSAAIAHHREALGILKRRITAVPSTPTRLVLAQAQVAVGDDLAELGDVRGAIARYREALVTSRGTVARDSASMVAARQVGVIEQRLGDAAAELGNGPEAMAHHAASLAVDRALADRNPDDIEIRRDLGTDLSRLGVAQSRWGSATQALALHQEARRLRETLLAEEPQDVRAAEDAAESWLEGGKALGALGRYAEAKREIAEGILRLRDLSARDPRNARWKDTLAGALAARAEVEARLGDRESSDSTLGEALALRRQLLAESPDFARNRAALEALERKAASGNQLP